jgi:hypothetical protein
VLFRGFAVPRTFRANKRVVLLGADNAGFD